MWHPVISIKISKCHHDPCMTLWKYARGGVVRFVITVRCCRGPIVIGRLRSLLEDIAASSRQTALIAPAASPTPDDDHAEVEVKARHPPPALPINVLLPHCMVVRYQICEPGTNHPPLSLSVVSPNLTKKPQSPHAAHFTLHAGARARLLSDLALPAGQAADGWIIVRQAVQRF